MCLGLLLLAKASVALRQRVVHAGCLRVQRQRLLQVLHRTRLVSPCLSDAAQPLEGRSGTRVDFARAEEQPLGILGSPLIQVCLAEANHRRQIGWVELERSFERLQRVRAIAGKQVELPQVVGPLGFARCQRLRVPQAGLGGRMVPGRHQDQADVAMRLGELFRRHLGRSGPRREGDIPVAHLRLHRWRQPREIGHRDRLHRPARVCCPGRRRRARSSIVARRRAGTAGGQHHRQRHDQPRTHRPLIRRLAPRSRALSSSSRHAPSHGSLASSLARRTLHEG